MIDHKRQLMFAVLLFGLSLSLAAQAGPTNGPLRVCEDNPRYFADADGKAVLLVGSHVWYNLVDMGSEDPPREFDYNAYLDWMAGYDHNYMRGRVRPQLYAHVGMGNGQMGHTGQ